MQYKDIYDYITREENSYATLPVQVVDGYEWKMLEHIKLTCLYLASKFSTGKDDGQRPFKNIMRPILNLQHRAEGFDVKDIELFIDDAKKYFKSFLVKKFHEKWARENQLDTFIDELVETYVNFGGVLIKNINEIKPEVVKWPTIAFVDQTDVMSGPICIKHYYSPDQLKEMEKKGWKNLDEVITLAQNKKVERKDGKETQTPGKFIEVYELHAMLPKQWLDDNSEPVDDKEIEFTRQLHIITYYQDEASNKNGITLFKGPEKELPFKMLKRDPIHGRALGFGGAEELFEAQVWVNYDMIRIKQLLDAASKVIFQTADTDFKNKNALTGLENGEILTYEDGKPLAQVNTSPVNIKLFENAVVQWEAHAQQTGAANDSIMGESPNAGTPFKLQELVTQEAHSLHEYRKGKIATFLDEIYRDWILPYIVREITHGQEFLSELSLDELQQVAEDTVECMTQDAIKEVVLSGGLVEPEEERMFREGIKSQFMKGGNKRFIQILKDEMKDAPLSVRVNIAGKQKYMAQMVDKLVNVFRTVVQNPAVLQQPAMAKLFNQILENSGLTPIDFSGLTMGGGNQPGQALPQPMTPDMAIPQANKPVASGTY